MTYKQEQALERARRVLKHYLRYAWINSGFKWTADNEAEVNGIVDDLKEACTP